MTFRLVRKPLAGVSPVPDLDAVYNPLGARVRRGFVHAGAAFEASIGAIEDALGRTGTRLVAGDVGAGLGERFERQTIGWSVTLVVLALCGAILLFLA